LPLTYLVTANPRMERCRVRPPNLTYTPTTATAARIASSSSQQRDRQQRRNGIHQRRSVDHRQFRIGPWEPRRRGAANAATACGCSQRAGRTTCPGSGINQLQIYSASGDPFTSRRERERSTPRHVRTCTARGRAQAHTHLRPTDQPADKSTSRSAMQHFHLQ